MFCDITGAVDEGNAGYVIPNDTVTNTTQKFKSLAFEKLTWVKVMEVHWVADNIGNMANINLGVGYYENVNRPYFCAMKVKAVMSIWMVSH